MQQTCPVGQFAEALHFSDATLVSPPPLPASGIVHPGVAAAQPKERPAFVCVTQQTSVERLQLVDPQLMVVVLPPGPASAGLRPPSPPTAPLDPPELEPPELDAPELDAAPLDEAVPDED